MVRMQNSHHRQCRSRSPGQRLRRRRLSARGSRRSAVERLASSAGLVSFRPQIRAAFVAFAAPERASLVSNSVRGNSNDRSLHEGSLTFVSNGCSSAVILLELPLSFWVLASFPRYFRKRGLFSFRRQYNRTFL